MERIASLSPAAFVGLMLTVNLGLAEPPPEWASRLAKLPLQSLTREYPNKPEHVLASKEELLTPRQLHPAFYGSYDWHSSVHGHWMLVRLLRRCPGLPEEKQIRRLLAQHLTTANLATELAYFKQPHHRSFERPYGWAWFLTLAAELHDWDDPQGQQWSQAVQPLAQEISRRYQEFFPKQLYPIRSGVHSETSFGLALALDYARKVGDDRLEQLVLERSRFYYLKDQNYPGQLEPGGDCFLSSALGEADLMRRVLPAEEFSGWFHRFLPTLTQGQPSSLLQPAQVLDRTDPKLVHLDGLNLSRAWALKGLSRTLIQDDPARAILEQAAEVHTQAGLAHVTSGDYAGEHWLASFACYLLWDQ